MTAAGGGAGRYGADMQARVNRGVVWVGIASSMVGVLDVLAFFIMITFWISQKEVGVAALATTLFPLFDMITDLGLTAAVIQRDDHTRDRISTVFWLNVLLSVFLAALLALVVGPILSAIQGQPILTWLLAAYGGKLLWQNVYFIPYALMKRELRFKELSILRIIANVAEFAGKVGFAWLGAGVWAFVLGPLCRVFVTGVGTQILHPWRPRAVLRLREALDWASYGMKTSGSKILFYAYSRLDFQVVGYFFGDTANGLYFSASFLVLQPAQVISEIVTNVAFPAFSRLKNDRAALVEQLVAFIRMNMVVLLAFLGLVVVSCDDIFALIEMVSTDEWTDAAPAARILCAVGVLRSLSFVIPPLLDGINRPMLTLRYMIIASIVLPLLFVLFALILGPWLDYLSVAVAWAVGYPVAFAALLFMTTTVLEMRISDLLRRIVGIAGSAAAATVLSLVVHLALAGAAVPLRFAAAGSVLLVAFFALLARFEGITIRSVARSLRG
jgi:O-antigen/teichoic acid export membrane protein